MLDEPTSEVAAAVRKLAAKFIGVSADFGDDDHEAGKKKFKLFSRN